jgi:hypothetical protein
MVQAGNTKRGSITVLLTSCLTGLGLEVHQMTIFVFICKTDLSKSVKQEVNGTVILPPLASPGAGLEPWTLGIRGKCSTAEPPLPDYSMVLNTSLVSVPRCEFGVEIESKSSTHLFHSTSFLWICLQAKDFFLFLWMAAQPWTNYSLFFFQNNSTCILQQQC